MSVEVNRQEEQGINWHAGVIEKVGTGVSVALMGSAFFFPEARVILASASVVVAGIDLTIMQVKSMLAEGKRQEIADQKTQRQAFESSEYGQLLRGRESLLKEMNNPRIPYRVYDDD